MCGREQRLHGRVGLRRTPLRVDDRTAAVLGSLDGRFAVRRETVERRVVHPDPERQPALREVGRLGRLEVGHLLEGHLERDVVTEADEHVVDPRVRADDEAVAVQLRREASPPRGRELRGRRTLRTGLSSRRSAPCRRASSCMTRVPRPAGTIAASAWWRASTSSASRNCGHRAGDRRPRRARRTRCRPRRGS